MLSALRAQRALLTHVCGSGPSGSPPHSKTGLFDRPRSAPGLLLSTHRQGPSTRISRCARSGQGSLTAGRRAIYMKHGNDDRPGDAARRHFHVSRLALLLAVVLCVPIGCGPQPGTRVLTTVGEIRALRPADAERGYPVRLSWHRHVLSRRVELPDRSDRRRRCLRRYRQDAGRGRAGREIEIEGITAAGESSPTIIATSVKNLAAGVIPAARRVSIKELSSGEFTRTEESKSKASSDPGRRENDGRLTLDVATADGVFQARVIVLGRGARSTGSSIPESRFEAWPTRRSTAAGEAIRLQLLVPRIGDVEVTGPRRQCRHAGTCQAVKPPVLRTVSEIRRLLPVEARRGYPVHLRAIVTSRRRVSGPMHSFRTRQPASTW